MTKSFGRDGDFFWRSRDTVRHVSEFAGATIKPQGSCPNLWELTIHFKTTEDLCFCFGDIESARHAIGFMLILLHIA